MAAPMPCDRWPIVGATSFVPADCSCEVGRTGGGAAASYRGPSVRPRRQPGRALLAHRRSAHGPRRHPRSYRAVVVGAQPQRVCQHHDPRGWSRTARSFPVPHASGRRPADFFSETCQNSLACQGPRAHVQPVGFTWPAARRTDTFARNERRDQNPSRHRGLGRYCAGRYLLDRPRRVASSPRCARARSRLSGHSRQARHRGTRGGPAVLAARVGHGVTAAVEASLGTVRQGHAHANTAWRVTLRHEPIGADVARRVASTAKVVLPTSRTTPRGHRSGASDDVTAIDRSGVRGGRRDDHGLHDQRPEQQRTALAPGGSGGDRRSGRGSRANVHTAVPAAGLGS